MQVQAESCKNIFLLWLFYITNYIEGNKVSYYAELVNR